MKLAKRAQPRLDFDKISRVVVVDDTGRAYEKWGVTVFLDVQDDERTLKLFLKDEDKWMEGN